MRSSGAGIDAILAAIDISPGCALKDSFACLDLASEGFDVLFEAQWIYRPADVPPPEPPAGMRWERVRDPAVLRGWERAWNQIPAGLFHPSLLEEDAVLVMAGYQGKGDRRRRHREPERDRYWPDERVLVSRRSRCGVAWIRGRL